MEWHDLAPGERKRIWWAPVFAASTQIPVLAVCGADPGPTVLVTGGVHGDEYEGPAAIQQIFRTLDAETLCGLFIGIPVVNTAAYAARRRTTPDDGVDLNRVFPGRHDGATYTAQLAYAVFDTFVRQSDVLLDLHSGGLRLVHAPLAGWYGDDAEGERIARGAGASFLPWRPAQRAGVLSYEAYRAGKIAVGMEWGGGAGLDAAGVKAYVTAITRALTHISGMPMDANQLDMRTPVAGDYQATDSGGLFVASVAIGDRVKAGQPLGALYDEAGAQVAAVHARQAGLVAGLAHLAKVEAGDRIVYIG